MTVRKTISIISVSVLFGSVTPVDLAEGGVEWELGRRVVEVQVTRSGQIFSVRYDDGEEFLPVEQGVWPELVEALSFYPRAVDLVLYYGENDGQIVVGYHNPRWCRTIFEEISKIEGLVQIDLDLSDGNMVIEFPHGQVVTVYEDEVDFGDGPELRTVDFREEAASGLAFRGFRSFTVFEFFDPNTNEVISRNVVATEVPLIRG